MQWKRNILLVCILKSIKHNNIETNNNNNFILCSGKYCTRRRYNDGSHFILFSITLLYSGEF